MLDILGLFKVDGSKKRIMINIPKPPVIKVVNKEVFNKEIVEYETNVVENKILCLKAATSSKKKCNPAYD